MKEFKEKIEVTRYETTDGRVFGNKEAATIHEGLLDGSIKVCSRCDGVGEIDPYGDCRVFKECPECKGSGYLHKQTIWSSR